VSEGTGTAFFACALHVKAAEVLFFLFLLVVGFHLVCLFLLALFTLFLIFYILLICFDIV
jgi:hypothetical protein